MTVDEYLQALVERVDAVLGETRVGVYALNSAAFGAYEEGRSDLDVAVVAARPLEPAEKDALVAALRHEALPCPARGLELVVYTAAEAASLSDPPRLELDLNTGAGTGFRVAYAEGRDEPHWFVIDLAPAARHARTLAGPPAAQVFGEVPRARVLTAYAALLDWQERTEPDAPNSVLNALRALRYVEAGEFGSKAEAVEWEGGPLGRAALAARRDGGRIDAELARELLSRVRRRVTEARA